MATQTTAPLKTIDCGDGIIAIDTYYHRPMMDASHLIIAQNEAAFIDVGTKFSMPHLLGSLDKYKVRREEVRYIILTHIHLDHAGGAGHLMQALPHATLLVHPRGLRHMCDPSKLWAGTVQVYGENNTKALYGELLPIDEKRIVCPNDGQNIPLGNRQLNFFYTLGHAKHHFCIQDQQSGAVFSGDSFGISYRELDSSKGPFILPTTTPMTHQRPASQTLKPCALSSMSLSSKVARCSPESVQP